MNPTPLTRCLGPLLALLCTSLLHAGPALSDQEQKLGFKPLSDGQTFQGWDQKGNWVIEEDGTFYRKAKGGDLTYTASTVPDDFELRFEWKVSKGCNSGVYYRPGQYEYQVLDNVNSPYGENPRQSAASLFFCMAPNKDATRPLGEWNEGRVLCQGTLIQHWLNGELVLDFDYTDPKWAQQVELLRIRGANLNARGGRIKLQDHGADVWFRHLRLRTVPKDEKLTRLDFQPLPIPAAALQKENERVQQMLKKAPAKPSAPAATAAPTKADAAEAAGPVKIIFDTDMHTDCDDAGALGVLHALADYGECEILAMLCSTLDPWAVPTIDAINTYYGRPDVPLGTVKGKGVLRKSVYTKGVAERFPHDVKSSDAAPDALQVYRQILEAQPDQSVVLVTVGYLTNVANLLKAPAQDGKPSGLDLVKQKVRTWVCMGGNFIGTPARDDLKLGNVNFTYDAPATLYAIQNWPGDLVFAGREVCSVPSGVAVGECLRDVPADHPVRVAYELYFGGELKNRHVADLASVLHAVRGRGEFWDIQDQGHMALKPDMTFTWEAQPDSRQAYLLKKKNKDGVLSDRAVEAALEKLLLQAPKAK
ncbi:family 16 glycoside hydrolase [Verrucomicrobium spinosum]|uniref:family 16 glycoside hydrolase n=1 Tax=Verrucomicrobium spinosum TaxID=2736 RepID=UPI0001746093|nr:family 16 glycoside hydrolase [Verrucomicrobium spinosum]